MIKISSSLPVLENDLLRIKHIVNELIIDPANSSDINRQIYQYFNDWMRENTQKIKDMAGKKQHSLYVDLADFICAPIRFINFNNLGLRIPIYKLLFIRPEYMLMTFEFVLKRHLADTYNYHPESGPYIRLFGDLPKISMKDLLENSHLRYGELYQVEGLSIAISQPTSIAIERTFECVKCLSKIIKEQPSGIVIPPSICTEQQCGGSKFRHVDIFDKHRLVQYVTIQQSTDEIKGSTEAYKLNIELYDDLIQQTSIRPGDSITIYGFLNRTYIPARVGTRPRYKYHFNALYIKKKHKDIEETLITSQRKRELLDEVHLSSIEKMHAEADKKEAELLAMNIPDEEKHELLDKLAIDCVVKIINGNTDFDLIREIRDSFAPNVIGKQYDSVKLALVSSLFTSRQPQAIDMYMFKDRSGEVELSDRKYKIRDVSHNLIIGDRATGKLELIKFLQLVVPNLMTTNGPSLTGKGITVGVAPAKDKDTGEKMMHIGAYIIADGGTLIIDEIDKMDTKYHADILQPMESLMVEKDVTGFGHQKFNARTGLIGFGNPKNGRWNPILKSLTKNFYLPEYLWSRFDHIFAIVDKYSKETDLLIAEFRGRIRRKKTLPDDYRPTFSADWLRDYIIYTSQEIHPELSEEVIKYLTKEYVEIRQKYSPERLADVSFHASGKASEVVGPTITPRNLEGFYRSSIALARIDHSSIVQIKHAKIAVELYLKSLRSVSEAVGSEDIIDPGLVITGKRSIREQTPWRNPEYKEYERVKMFLEHLFIEQKTSPIEKNELLNVLAVEVLLYTTGAKKARAEQHAEKIFERLESRGKLYQPRGDNHYDYKK